MAHPIVYDIPIKQAAIDQAGHLQNRNIYKEEKISYFITRVRQDSNYAQSNNSD